MKDSVDARASRVSDPTVQVSTQITAFFVLEGIPPAGRSPSGISGGLVSTSFSIFSASNPKSRVLMRVRVDARASPLSDPTVQVSTQITAFFVLEGIPTAGRYL